MYYAVIRTILSDNCNMPAMKTPRPGSHGLLLKGTAWLYNYHSDWQGKGQGERAAGEEIFSIWMNRSAALDTMLFWSSQGSYDIMPHSHTVSKIPCGQLQLPTSKCFCSLYSEMHTNSSLMQGQSTQEATLCENKDVGERRHFYDNLKIASEMVQIGFCKSLANQVYLMGSLSSNLLNWGQ